jgi:Ca2+-binding RTX toxin-like protein
MRSRRTRRLGLACSLAVLAALALALPASGSAATLLYANGHGLDETRLTTFGGHTAVDPGVDGFDGCSDAEWATALARTDFDVLVVGESAPSCFVSGSLSPDTVTAIGNYVRGGKPIIILGAHTDEDEFMNAAFGFNTENLADDSSESLIGLLQPSAAGTPFEGGPEGLTTPSATELLGGTPERTIYAGPEGVYVFTVPVGAGVVTYLAWDFCCGSDAPIDDWYRVLDRALQVRPPVPSTPAPAAAPSDRCQGRNATIIGTPGNDNLTGTAGADVIVALGGSDKVNGLGGNDVVCGRTGKDRLKGGAGSDRLQGNKSSDRLIGNGGKDRCLGGLGTDSAAQSCESVKGL